MEKNTTDCLKGAAAVVVMLYHLTFYSDNRMLSLIFANTGQLAVAVFLFMSGYGLTVRFQKKGRQYFEGFWLNKVFHLILIFLVSGTVVTVINNIFFHTDYNVADCPVSFLVLIYLFTLRVRVNSRILKFFNQMTFELYLVHLIVYKIFFSVRDPGIRWYIPMYAVILMLAYITMQADKAVFKGARKLADCICVKHRKA